MSADQDVYDERLWMKVANLTGAAGNSTALVGTPEQVAEAMLRYYDIGITTLLLKGFDPLADADRLRRALASARPRRCGATRQRSGKLIRRAPSRVAADPLPRVRARRARF